MELSMIWDRVKVGAAITVRTDSKRRKYIIIIREAVLMIK